MLLDPDPARFRAWLANLPAEAIVGIANDLRECPLGRFLREEAAALAPYLAPDRYSPNASVTEERAAAFYPYPEWAQRFRLALDETAAAANDLFMEVPAHLALQLLERNP